MSVALSDRCFGRIVVAAACLWMLTVAATARGAAAPAADGGAAASYRVLPVDESLKGERTTIGTMLRNGTFGPGESQTFARYFNNYFLAQWSVPEHRTNIKKWRTELRQYFGIGKSGAVYEELNRIVLKFCGAMAQRPEFHLAARVNAMLAIGELNVSEENPQPYPAALDVLLKTATDPKQSEAVRVAALIGLARHARSGIASPDAVNAAMLKLLTTKAEPGVSDVGQIWMRAQAAEILGDLKAAGNNGAVAQALAAVAADATATFDARCAAAEALGKLNYQGAGAIDASSLAMALGRLAADACDDAQKMKPPAPQPSADQAPDAPVPTSTSASALRRPLKMGLVAAQTGLKGVAAAATGPPHQGVVAGIGQSLDAMLALFDDKQKDDEQLLKEIGDGATKLRALLTKKP